MYFQTLGGILVTHLCFADDFIIFSNETIKCIKDLKVLIDTFEKQSGLAINCGKSCFITSSKVKASKINCISTLTSFVHQLLPFKYLRIPIYKGQKQSFLFDYVIQAIMSKISS